MCLSIAYTAKATVMGAEIARIEKNTFPDSSILGIRSGRRKFSNVDHTGKRIQSHNAAMRVVNIPIPDPLELKPKNIVIVFFWLFDMFLDSSSLN